MTLAKDPGFLEEIRTELFTAVVYVEPTFEVGSVGIAEVLGLGNIGIAPEFLAVLIDSGISRGNPLLKELSANAVSSPDSMALFHASTAS